MIIQIYEIQTPHEAEECIKLGVDHIGSVILDQDEWRIPLLRQTIRLSDETDAKSSLIPLFRQREVIYRALDYYRPDYIHFCDSLTGRDGLSTDLEKLVLFQSDIRKQFPEVGIIRSIPMPKRGVRAPFSCLEIAAALESSSDIFLTDTWVEKAPVEGFIGITGETVGWDIARSLVLQSNIPVILAGGLSPENVFSAITEVLPAGVDSCTHTNRVDKRGNSLRFMKDFRKVGTFVKQVRMAETELGRGKGFR